MLQCRSPGRAMRVLAVFPVAMSQGRETEHRLRDHAGSYDERCDNTNEVA